MTHCIIGAGYSGLPVAKRLIELGLDVDIYERNSGFGGVWHTGLYRDAVSTSSRKMAQYPDYAMPLSYPEFPNKQQMQMYFRQYAEEFGIAPHTRFGQTVCSVTWEEKHKGSLPWRVETLCGQVNYYQGVVMATGYKQKPKLGCLQGSFTGEVLQLDEYYDASVFTDKRVLIVGCGNSACEIAVEAARVAKVCDLSIRTGNVFLPKTLFGKPLDELLNHRLLGYSAVLNPLLDAISAVIARNIPRHFRKPASSLTSMPSSSDKFLEGVGRRDISLRPGTTTSDGSSVTFTDATRSDYDLVLFCTGSDYDAPCLNRGDQVLKWDPSGPELLLNCISPTQRGLFFCGMGLTHTSAGKVQQAWGYTIARIMALDSSSSTAIADSLRNHWLIMLGVFSRRLKLVGKPEPKPRAIFETLDDIGMLNRILDSIDGKVGRPRRSKAKNQMPDYLLSMASQGK